MQRRPQHGSASSAFPSSSSGAGPLDRSNSKASSNKQRQRKRASIVGLTICLPILLGSALLFFTRLLSPHPNTATETNDSKLTVRALANGKDTKDDDVAAPKTKTKSDKNNPDDDVEYHIVFSTGCSLYQDWQSYVFFFQAMRSQQPGTVTRIVSGCEPEDQEKMAAQFAEEIRPMAPDGRFQIHFTPDYSKTPSGKTFVYWNKPYGMRHWLENKLGFPNNPINEHAIVILMDPDQLIMRPFTNNDFSNTVWKFIPKNEEPYTRIEHGKPMGQFYGFALQWLDKVNITALAGDHSPIAKLSRDEARRGYIVGPPYVATARDMYSIVQQWSDFAKPVYEMYPYLLAEMFAYCLAAAQKELPHQTAASFMISDVLTGNMEGWSYIDKMPENEICGGWGVEELPNVLHFCQRYGLGKYFFGKRKLPKDFLTCHSPLMAEPPHDLMEKYEYAVFPGGVKKEWKPDLKKRNAFVICIMIPALNAAATYYKKRHCDAATANYEKSLIFFEHLDMADLK